MSAPTVRQKLRYAFDNTMSKGTKALIAWLLIVTTALVLVGGTLAVIVSSQDDNGGFGTSLWAAFMHVLDPSLIASDTTGGGFLISMLLIALCGIVIVSCLVGILTTGLDAKLAELRKGRSLIVETGHTVVLGWSDQVFTIISELVEANESERRACIAILADKDKVEMEDEIRDKISDLKSTKVICRTGDPADPDDIRIVNLATAASVILLTSDEPDPDAQLVRSLLAVTQGADNSEAHVVGSVSDSRNLPAARLAGGRRTHLIDATDMMARLMVQTCRQSGLSVVYTDLLDFGGDEMYFTEQPQLVGWNFGQVLNAFASSTVMGVKAANGRTYINPPARSVIQPGDQIIVIAEDDSTIRLDGTPSQPNEVAIMARGEASSRPERTLILGWNARGATMLQQLDAYVAPGSVTDVVSANESMSEQIREVGHTMKVQALNFKADDPTKRSVLESLGVGGYNHIIALCGDEVEPALADSRTLVTLLHLRDMGERSGTRFPVVSEMADDRNRGLAQVTQADDFIVSEKLVSLMMTQTSENPHLTDVFTQLFDPEGSEIYLKPSEYYIRPGYPVDMYTIVESAKRRSEVALGYRLAAHSHEAPNYGIFLNPAKSQSVTFQPGDKVIVLAED